MLREKVCAMKRIKFTEDGIVDGPEVWLTAATGGRGLCHPIEIFSLDEQGDQPYLLAVYDTEEWFFENCHKISESFVQMIMACQVATFRE